MAYPQQGSWKQRIMGRWFGSAKVDRRRWLGASADVGVALAVVAVLAVLVIPRTPYLEDSSAVPQAPTSPPEPIVETALEHARQHMQPGYRCPIHPEVVGEAPGRCPICGEELVPALTALSPPELQPIDVVAYVDYSGHSRNVVPDTEGWVERIIKAKPGQRIRQGDVLLEIYSPELAHLQRDYLDAQQRKDALVLIDARNRLRVYGQSDDIIRALASAQQVDGVIRVRAPTDGIITDVYVPEGIFVPQGIPVVAMVDTSSVWMNAKVPLAKIFGLAPGAKVEARSPLLGNEVLHGETVAVDISAADDEMVAIKARFDKGSKKLTERQHVDLRIFPAQSIAGSTPRVANAGLEEEP